MGWRRKLALFLRVWLWFARIQFQLRATPLPLAVNQLRSDPRASPPRLPAAQLSGIVRRSLRLGDQSRRCLPSALVLYRLLIEQGDRPEVVIGLQPRARSHEAHAWVELDGANLGPSPGGQDHLELARYG